MPSVSSRSPIRSLADYRGLGRFVGPTPGSSNDAGAYDGLLQMAGVGLWCEDAGLITAAGTSDDDREGLDARTRLRREPGQGSFPRGIRALGPGVESTRTDWLCFGVQL
jgi:hypothetical protein